MMPLPKHLMSRCHDARARSFGRNRKGAGFFECGEGLLIGGQSFVVAVERAQGFSARGEKLGFAVCGGLYGQHRETGNVQKKKKRLIRFGGGLH